MGGRAVRENPDRLWAMPAMQKGVKCEFLREGKIWKGSGRQMLGWVVEMKREPVLLTWELWDLFSEKQDTM